MFCVPCAADIREIAEQRFWQVRALCLQRAPCDECGGTLVHASDPFGDRDEEEMYECADCHMQVALRRPPSPALRLAQSLRYVASNEAPMPPASFSYTEGKRQYRVIDTRKPQASRKDAA